MKHKALPLALALAALASPLFSPSASAEVSFEYFQESLSPFGEWIEVGNYGLCWRPTGVAGDWAPYTDGYWAYTDAGWTWVSYEDWGGITYHYGRWVHVRGEGWVWVPDYDWGPAWVSWRSNDNYVGWAPLPPEARWEENTGFSVWVDTSYDIGPDNYRFCHTYDFGAPVLAPVCLPYEQNVTIIQSTVNITNICYDRGNSEIFCGGPNFVNINSHCRQPVPALRLVREDRAVRDALGHAPPQVLRGNQLAVFAPKVTRPADLKALPITARKIIGADKINHGWTNVPDLAVQEDIRKKLRKQSEGLTPATAPARPVKAEDLSNIPKKADPNAPPPNVVARTRDGRAMEGVAARPQGSPALVQPQRPASATDLPRSIGNRAGPNVRAPLASEPAQPPMERPVQPQPFNKPRTEKPARPAQAATAPANVQPEPPTLQPPPVAAQDADNKRRDAEAVRRQQEAAQRANELRNQQVQRIEAVRQQQEAAQRANEARNQQVQQQRQQSDAADQRREAAQRANELRSQQMEQQRQQARQADAVRQQQESAQRAVELRRDQVQQQHQQAQQFEAAQRANQLRSQQAEQIAAQRASEVRQQHAQQAEAPSRVQAPPPPRHAQPQPQPNRPSSNDGDGDGKKHKGGR